MYPSNSPSAGGEGKPSIIGIECGSVAYWLIVTSLIPFVVIYLAGFGWIVKREYDRKVACHYPFLDTGKFKGCHCLRFYSPLEDIRYTTPMLVKIPFYCLVAGIAAGLFGIGSGMIINPVLLSLNVPPRV